ncbi:DUF3859 domain-containing protein [Pseudooctadecabacter jejudonensis]|uniref:DUF3859 domain-containing protein n=1 Tax=Pseudooctadecabacter jejudonensis TaxID=1391910 RepID=A0A1Y5S0G3_9RHOB|nr:DUF3859 domain-containing protein [Pseudooctadecabacter jejudonensis]SLN29186.1 hypothetical protein PSJ8397_01257 [Pseudooctadecabacter jejudonensis]
MVRSLCTVTTALAFGWGGFVLAADDAFQSPLLGLFEAGVLCAQDEGTSRAAPDTVAGTTHVVTRAPEFISDGRLVPAVIGVGFGVRSGLRDGMMQDGVTMTVTHPPFAGSGATQQSFQTRIGSDTDPGITFYQFDYDYELALGDWTMTASLGAVTLYEVTFTVVPPETLPNLADACGYQNLFS